MSTVSVVIPAYNSENFIGATIESILSQTYTDFTLTVIDDVSTDHTGDTVRKYKDPRIRFVKNEKNLGLTGNFDHSLDFMRGAEYGLLVCNDDIIGKDYLKAKVGAFEKDPEVVLVCNATNIINPKGKRLFVRKTQKEDVLDGRTAIYRSYLAGNIFGEPSGVMLRTSVLDKIKGYDQSLKYVLDWEFSVRAAALGKVAFLKEPLNSFRVSQGSATSGIIRSRKNVRREHDFVASEIEQILGFHPGRFLAARRHVLFEIRFFLRLFVFRILSLL